MIKNGTRRIWRNVINETAIWAANFVWSICLLIMVGTLLLRPSLHPLPAREEEMKKNWQKFARKYSTDEAEQPSRVNRFSLLRTEHTSSEAYQWAERAFSPMINFIRHGNTFPFAQPVFFAWCLIKNLSLQQVHSSLCCNENCSVRI